jgi:hypothetical protein
VHSFARILNVPASFCCAVRGFEHSL